MNGGPGHLYFFDGLNINDKNGGWVMLSSNRSLKQSSMQIIAAVDIVRIAQAGDTNKEWFAKFATDKPGPGERCSIVSPLS
jgi:hypothetical protein